jgi:hypothetical protein
VSDLTLNDLVPVIKRASKSVAYQWPGVIDADDVEQGIYIHLLERQTSVEKIYGMDDLAKYRAVVGIGHQIASQERTAYDHFKGSYSYSVGEIKDLLKQGVLEDEAPDHFKAELVDMELAFAEMDARVPQYVDAIHARYALHQVPAQGAAAKRLSDALTSLADAMNKVARNRFSSRDDGLGTRELISREQALDLSGSEWDGEDDL